MKSIKDKILLFLLNPFLSAVLSLKNIRDGVSHCFLYLWFLLFGIGFCCFNDSLDSSRYKEDFQIEHQYTITQYTNHISEYFSADSRINDIYTTTVNFLVGRFSDNYHWAFFIYAMVFGLFYIGSLKIFLKFEVDNNLVFYSLLFLFCFSNPIFNINGVRFWTSAWIGVFVSLKLFVEHKYNYLPLLVLIPLVHGASTIWIAIMLLAFLTQRFQNIWIVLYVLSSFVSAVSYLNVLDDYSYLFPQFIQDQIWSYTQSDGAIRKMENMGQISGYADVLNALPGYFVMILSYILIFRKRDINQSKSSKSLLTVFFAMSAITNFLSGVPSLGRFQFYTIPFLAIVWAKNYAVLKQYNKIFVFMILFYAYRLLYWFRYMVSVTELYLYILPAPVTIVKYLFMS